MIPHAATIPHIATWTPERVEQLRSCFDAGLSCSQIARQIGVTRNAVIGKMNRLGLSRPKDLVASLPKPQRATGGTRTRAWRPKLWDRPGRVQDQILMAVQPDPRPVAEAMSGESACSLLDLSQGKCRWPLNDPGAEDFCFCGRAPIEGLPYCLGHARMAYRSATRHRGSVRP